MSSQHSRSSSEIETYRYEHFFMVNIEQFIKDFEFANLEDDQRSIFMKHEIDEIMAQQKNKAKQTLVVFWALFNKPDSVIEKFLEILNVYYDWLSALVRQAYYNPEGSEIYVQAVQDLLAHESKFKDFNVHRLEMYEKLCIALRKGAYQNVVLLGEIGTGKKWLALDVCTDYRVMQQMQFKIFWLDVHKCASPIEDLEMLEYLYIKLDGGMQQHHCQQIRNSGDGNIENRILDMQQKIKKEIKKLKLKSNRNCLLVLQNVQNTKTLQAFNLGCRRLIITRSKKVSDELPKKYSKLIEMDNKLSESEFYTLFEKHLKQPREQFQNEAYKIYRNIKAHPLISRIIAQNMRKGNTSWNKWMNNLADLQITYDETYMEKVTELSFRVLSKEQLQLYAVLAIFPHSTRIPFKLLSALWNRQEHEVIGIVNKFDEYSMVHYECDQEQSMQYCILPYIYSPYLKESETIKKCIDSVALHGKVIEFYQDIIRDILQPPTDFISQTDEYFYACVAYHLERAKRLELFPQLFLNFNFLEQKIRTVGLLDTMSDLSNYRKQIIGDEPRRQQLLSDLFEFLPLVEEKLVLTRDSSLLQNALMTSGAVYDAAMQQAQEMRQRVWFSENGNFHQRRQIINLPKQPRMVLYLGGDEYFIELQHEKNKSQKILINIASDCNNSPIELLQQQQHNTNILCAQTFDNERFLMTLDLGGNLIVWSLEDVSTSLQRVGSSKSKATTRNFQNCQKMTSRTCTQCIYEDPTRRTKSVVSFQIEQQRDLIYLHVAFATGEIFFYQWQPQKKEFYWFKTPGLATGNNSIRFVSKVLGTHYLLLDKYNNLEFWHLNSSSKIKPTLQFPQQNSSFIYCSVHENRAYFVFGNALLLLNLIKTSTCMLNGQVHKLHSYNDVNSKSLITCAKLSNDECYMALGTKHGLIIFDNKVRAEVLRNSVSESIACVDISELNDPINKYVVICGAERKSTLKLLLMRQRADGSLCWAHHLSVLNSQEMCKEPQLTPTERLLGQQLYAIKYQDGNSLLLAVDSKYRIHQIDTKANKSWTIVKPAETNHAITAICISGQQSFAGYESGDIYDINAEEFLKSKLKVAVNYLQIFDEQLLLASTNADPLATIPEVLTLIYLLTTKREMRVNIDTKQAYFLLQRYLLILSNRGYAVVLDIKAEKELKIFGAEMLGLGTDKMAGCDYKAKHLFLTTPQCNVCVYRFEQNFQKHVLVSKFDKILEESRACCLTAAHDGSLIAIGLMNGNVEIFKQYLALKQSKHDGCDYKHIFTLKSHCAAIADLQFSPCLQVLVSCAEQLCFWSVPYILNNPNLAKTDKRRSSRFSSNRTDEEVDAQPVFGMKHLQLMHMSNGNDHANGNGNGNENASEDIVNGNMCNYEQEQATGITSPWLYRQGREQKPELLACIKFDGNRAERFFANHNFTQFNVIDDEGVYYDLSLMPTLSAKQAEKDEMDANDFNQQKQQLPAYTAKFSYIENYYAYNNESSYDVVPDI